MWEPGTLCARAGCGLGWEGSSPTSDVSPIEGALKAWEVLACLPCLPAWGPSTETTRNSFNRKKKSAAGLTSDFYVFRSFNNERAARKGDFEEFAGEDRRRARGIAKAACCFKRMRLGDCIFKRKRRWNENYLEVWGWSMLIGEAVPG